MQRTLIKLEKMLRNKRESRYLKIPVFWPCQFQEKEKTNSGYKHNNKVNNKEGLNSYASVQNPLYSNPLYLISRIPCFKMVIREALY